MACNYKRIWKENGRCVQCGGDNDRKPITICGACTKLQKKRQEKCNLRLKIDTFNAYGGCFCSCCGEKEMVMLTIDHIDGNGAQHRRELRRGRGDSGGGGNKTYYWLKHQGYPSGYRVLCFNCNQAMHVLGYCPHQTSISVSAQHGRKHRKYATGMVQS